MLLVDMIDVGSMIGVGVPIVAFPFPCRARTDPSIGEVLSSPLAPTPNPYSTFTFEDDGSGVRLSKRNLRPNQHLVKLHGHVNTPINNREFGIQLFNLIKMKSKYQ